MPSIDFVSLRDDLTGGLVSAALAIPLAMGYGMFAFGSLGDSYFAYGALSGLYAAMVAGIAMVAFGDRTTNVYAPRVTTTFFLGGLLYHLVHSDTEILRSSPHLTILTFFLIILLGGAFQALFGLVRLGTLIRFTPQPVMAGLQNAAAALLFLVQLGNICGFDRNYPFTQVVHHLSEIRPLSLALAAVTFGAMWKARAITTKIPPLLVGLGIGTALYILAQLAGLGAHLGPVIGMPSAPESPAPLKNISDLAHTGKFIDILPWVLGASLALAIVAAIDALLCAKLVTPAGAPKLDGNRLLLRLGLANMATAGFGGITNGFNIGASIANRTFGAKSPLSVIINAAILLLVILALFPLVSYLPRAVLSATIMVIAVQHIDPWSLDLVQRVRTRAARHRGLMLLDLAVVVAVALLSVTINIVFAVFIGIALAILLFIVRMSRSNIRRTYRADAVHSRKARTPADIAMLEKSGGAILIMELQGALFFGSGEMLGNAIGKAADSGTRAIVLDLRRVTEIDATGAAIMAEVSVGLARKGQHLALAVGSRSEIAARLHEAGVIDAIGAALVFEDVDRAIEWEEDELLRAAAQVLPQGEMPVGSADLFRSLTPAEVVTLTRHLRRTSFAKGNVIFRAGEPGTELFVVGAGRASAFLHQSDGADIRLATFAPGTVFGELAILDAGPRSATLVADDDLVCHVLSQESFAALSNDAPAVAIKLLAGLGRELSARLRRANRTIYQLES